MAPRRACPTPTRRSRHRSTTSPYDAYFYGSNLGLAENIEFDIAQFFNHTGYYFGTQCQIRTGGDWGVWDNVNAKWVPVGIPCKPNSNSWNHVTIQFQRTSDNRVRYQSLTLNGVTSTLNWKYPPYSQPGWFGVVMNFQLDGNYRAVAVHHLPRQSQPNVRLKCKVRVP